MSALNPLPESTRAEATRLLNQVTTGVAHAITIWPNEGVPDETMLRLVGSAARQLANIYEQMRREMQIHLMSESLVDEMTEMLGEATYLDP